MECRAGYAYGSPTLLISGADARLSIRSRRAAGASWQPGSGPGGLV